MRSRMQGSCDMHNNIRIRCRNQVCCMCVALHMFAFVLLCFLLCCIFHRYLGRSSAYPDNSASPLHPHRFSRYSPTATTANDQLSPVCPLQFPRLRLVATPGDYTLEFKVITSATAKTQRPSVRGTKMIVTVSCTIQAIQGELDFASGHADAPDAQRPSNAQVERVL